MQLIDGKAVSEKVLEECSAEIEKIGRKGKIPGLAVVLVGNDPASKAYVGSKVRTCEKLGVHSLKIELPEETSQERLLQVIDELNQDSKIHGILVQSPPPSQIDESAVVLAIKPEKDVDGFHPENVAKLTLEDSSGFVPCTPLGCLRLLQEYNVETNGVDVVVVGRSMIVGKSMALLLMSNNSSGNSTVTVAHSRTKNLESVCSRADIIIAAVGRPHFLTDEHISEGAVVIDVGINRLEDKNSKKGYKLVGDVDFDSVVDKCKAITPVPGGVGPMTIAMLISNTIKACKRTM
ncbi:MAG: bifunctional methylenetetrahydrofolate dehydrogenase/methenyltetrahydrofolate cyclohydrolase FolD [Rickettsiales bacterium]|nr:bifunctional methylenetetrahydrofolate dehydrogenase/methenyltetrahydrofolate cyclohydrolase FolD [Verrucomicrobiales bacterium]MBV63833.1 bifunctional methylenetetrahydrofolate dehydrogenase/methenyltetrahydrofolate cyclohydrolase FolD [Rickettsiales bacterium]|tara:strand:- start:2250 stop:3125 length:876 start_codon:yes stop_codon:yes gene_type:complete